MPGNLIGQNPYLNAVIRQQEIDAARRAMVRRGEVGRVPQEALAAYKQAQTRNRGIERWRAAAEAMNRRG